MFAINRQSNMLFVYNFSIISVIILMCYHVDCGGSTNSHICYKRIIINGKSERRPSCCTGYIVDDTVSLSDYRLVCKPICMPACVNATCINPGQCECNTGYKAGSSDFTCEPVCKPVSFSQCISPNNFICNHGYELVNETCRPACTEPCLFGKCVTPETCECNIGYRKSDRNICEPYCSRGCDHGTCEAPDWCKCDEGWSMVNGTCSPICNNTCENGTCVDVDTCQCNEGFVPIGDVCLGENDKETTTTFEESSTVEPSPISDYFVPQMNLTYIETNNEDAEIKNDNCCITIATKSNFGSLLIGIWIVIVVLLILLIAVLVYKWRTFYEYWRGKSYDVGENEARQMRRRRNSDRTNIEINNLRSK